MPVFFPGNLVYKQVDIMMPLAIDALAKVGKAIEKSHVVKLHMPRPAPLGQLLQSAVLSKLAYLPEKDVTRYVAMADPTLATARVCFHDGTLRGQDAQAYTITSHKGSKAHIVFRGASTVQDIRSSLDISRKLNRRQVPVYTGLENQYASIRDSILEDVEAAHEVVLTGHGPGGAMAALAAVDVGRRCAGARVRLHTFAAPRAGGDAFSQVVEESVDEHWRVVGFDDIAPCLPPVPGYSHGDTANVLVLFQDDQAYVVCKGDVRPLGRLAQVLVRVVSDPGDIANDYSIDTYMRQLREQAVNSRGGLMR